MTLLLLLGCPTVCVTRKWAGMDNAWEQKKLEARKKHIAKFIYSIIAAFSVYT
jgi:hypothetical protein